MGRKAVPMLNEVEENEVHLAKLLQANYGPVHHKIYTLNES